MSQTVPGPVLVSAKGLALSYPGMDVFKDLSFELRPGLTLVRGGDGRAGDQAGGGAGGLGPGP